MFESRTEKGLFTFYWEQFQPPMDNQMHTLRKSRQSLNSFEQLPKADNQDMEEKKITKLKTHKPTKKPKTMKIEDILSHQLSSKENIRQKIPQEPVTVDLSQLLTNQFQERAFKIITNNKFTDKIAETGKRSYDLPILPKKDSDRSKNMKQSKEQQIFGKLIKGQLSMEPSRLNLQITEEVTKKKEINRQLRSTKNKKTLKKDQILKKINKTERDKKINSNGLFTGTETSSYKFPKLHPHQPSLKKQKQPYLLEKIMMDRQQIDRSSSVITLGIDSCEEYKSRWQRKKAEFLKILSRNMADSPRE